MKNLFKFFKKEKKQISEVPEDWKVFFTPQATIKNLEKNEEKYQYYVDQVNRIFKNNINIGTCEGLKEAGDDVADNPFLFNAIRGLKIEYLDCETGYSEEICTLRINSLYRSLTVTTCSIEKLKHEFSHVSLFMEAISRSNER